MDPLGIVYAASEVATYPAFNHVPSTLLSLSYVLPQLVLQQS